MTARSEVDALADDLEALLAALRHGRNLGLEVTAPVQLVQACRDLITEADDPPHDTRDRPSVRATAPAPRNLAPHLPGEQFTATDVTDRLDTRGRLVTPAKVSNALGYWVDRSRLTRISKGHYHYPGSASPDEIEPTPAP